MVLTPKYHVALVDSKVDHPISSRRNSSISTMTLQPSDLDHWYLVLEEFWNPDTNGQPPTLAAIGHYSDSNLWLQMEDDGSIKLPVDSWILLVLWGHETTEENPPVLQYCNGTLRCFLPNSKNITAIKYDRICTNTNVNRKSQLYVTFGQTNWHSPKAPGPAMASFAK